MTDNIIPLREVTEQQELAQRMQLWGLEHKQITLDTPLAGLGIFNDDAFPGAKTLRDVLAPKQEKEEEEEDESSIPIDSQLGQDAARYIKKYFPGSRVVKIESSYHRGVFAGDYTINLDVELEHPLVEKVEMFFTHRDLPYRPSTWKELLALPGICLFMTSITLRNVGYDEKGEQTGSVTFSTPGVYQEEMKQWWEKLDDGELVGHIETPNLFIITSQAVDHEQLEHLGEAVEEEIRRKRREYAEELALITMPPRTIEVSEREYREIMAYREKVAEPELGDLDDHPF